ncbi:FAD:protein FMN transferase [Clostridium sp. WILCCON 0269]|uniref:FAD:protein FMN transferase n=1 Tax=Candidatus Clostridium eludens TaxID=3381663 RepID=A0ABW8STN0_9CLOT
MSAFKNDSNVMQINHYAGFEAQKINIDTFNLLKRALDFSRASGGAFDITIRPLTEQRQSIDLGGIAKGYAADEVKRVLLQYKIENTLINLGGNTITMGHNPTGTPWRIGIQNPLFARGQYIVRISVTNKTVVTSGSNEQFFIKEGERYHHIIDPRTGYPSKNELLSVTVLCECSTDADAVTTALFVQNINKSIP